MMRRSIRKKAAILAACEALMLTGCSSTPVESVADEQTPCVDAVPSRDSAFAGAQNEDVISVHAASMTAPEENFAPI